VNPWRPLPEVALQLSHRTAERWAVLSEEWATGRSAEELRASLHPKRVLVLDETITDAVATRLISELLFLDYQDPSEAISLFVHSSGGVVTAAAAIVDAIAQVQAPVAVVVPRRAAGAAVWIAAAGQRSARYVGTNARLTLLPLVVPQDDPRMEELQRRELRRLEDLWETSLSTYTGRSRDEVRVGVAESREFVPKAAIEWGLVDGVLE
jgi:ATP-dependent Clp protease protease subunit